MRNPVDALNEQFSKCVKSQQFPAALSSTRLHDTDLTPEQAIAIFSAQIASRQFDLITRELKASHQFYYSIGSSGHEGNAAVAAAFRYDDMAFLHYRSAAFFLQRLNQAGYEHAERDLLLSFAASKDDPMAQGRHKVLGSKAYFIPPQTSTIASHLPKAVGAAMSIARAKELAITSTLAEDSVVICSFGDASINHASAQSALNTASWIAYQHYPLPLVFVCEDNGWGISVKTPADWVAVNLKARANIHYLYGDGLNIFSTYAQAKRAEQLARKQHQPVFLHMKCVRLLGHAGSDIESLYRTETECLHDEFNDPLLHSARLLIDEQVLSIDDVLALYQTIGKRIRAQTESINGYNCLDSRRAIMASIVPNIHHASPNPASEAQRRECFAEQYEHLHKPRNMSQSINHALTDLMLQYPNTVLFGEDVGKKGGVYHVTANLQQRFGQRRVFDTLLDETTILGTAIGMAHNGFLPIPEIQFFAYLHNAEDQLRGEAATLSFFSNGQFTNPMLLRIACFAYQKGFGGHFHNDNSIAVLRDIPGIIIACPSSGADAAKMLRTCAALAYEQQRIVVFLEPIALYMQKDLHQPGDGLWLCDYPRPDETIGLGEINKVGDSKSLAIISYANGFYLSLQAKRRLEEEHHTSACVIDLRWLAPLPIDTLIAELHDVSNILIVDECRQTGSISEALITAFYEHGISANIKRITAADSFITLGTSWEHLLPSTKEIINTALTMLT